MGRFFRWASIAVLGIVVVAMVATYPRLSTQRTLGITAEPSVTAPAQIEPAASNTPAPTLALPPTPTASGAVVIVPASQVGTGLVPSASPSESAATVPAPPAAAATTSLLPGLTPVVAPPAVPAALFGGSPSTPAPVPEASQPVIATAEATVTAGATFHSVAAATPDTGSVSTAALTATLAGDSAPMTAAVTPSPNGVQLVAAAGMQPETNTATPHYAGPGWDFPIVGSSDAGQPVDIVAWYTEGTWYLLATGAWVPASAVDYSPSALPLVFPTPTFTPTPTPTVTPTPGPTEPPPASPTPTPTATSLAEPICDCSADRYDCLGNVFSSQSAAQLCFDFCFRQRSFDVHNLDPNLNGRACENLP